jgi:hypothetical protein
MRLSRRATVALGLLSAGALCFEVALLRLYAVQQFYHFAFLIISLAVLGTAAGGTALALRSRPAAPAGLAVGFATAVLLAYATLNLLPFDSYAVAWDRRQVAVLGLYFGSAALPFFFHGWFTGAALAAAGSSPGKAYAANLLGAAAGPPIALLATATLRLESAVALSSAAGLVSAGLLIERRSPRMLAYGLALALGVLALRPPEGLRLRLSPNKAVAQAELYPQAEVTVFRDGVSARLEVVESDGVHNFPGLSLNYSGPLPAQAGFYLDGDGPLAATALDPAGAVARQLAQSMPAGLAYELRPGARALVLDPGAGLQVALALAAGAAEVHAPVDEPLLLEALQGPYSDFTFHLAEEARLRWLPTNSRGALAGHARYDVIDFALTDPFRPVASGAFSLSEDYGLTVEAMAAALRHLSGDGVLVLTRWLTTPPAESLRAWSTLLAAMDRSGVQDASARIVVYRSLRTSTVLVSSRPWTEAELAVVRRFLDRNGFDPITLPDLSSADLNRFNRIPDDPYPALFRGLLDDPQDLQRTFPYQIAPTSDDRPFFFHFFRWQQTPEVLTTFGQTWQPFGGSGYLVLLALLALMLVLAALLCLAPSLSRQVRGRLSLTGGLYFACLGAGFMFIELSLLQRFTLPLERASLAFTVVLSVLLLASGIGSRLSDRVRTDRTALLLGGVALGWAFVVPAIIPLTLDWSFAARLTISILVLFPLGFLMGIPFPVGLRWFTAGEPGRVGWAWSVNGAASAVAGVLGAMIAIDLGLRALMLLGGLAYLAGWVALRREILRTAS